MRLIKSPIGECLGDVWGNFSSSKNGLVEPFVSCLGNLGDIFYISLEKN